MANAFAGIERNPSLYICQNLESVRTADSLVVTQDQACIQTQIFSDDHGVPGVGNYRQNSYMYNNRFHT